MGSGVQGLGCGGYVRFNHSTLSKVKVHLITIKWVLLNTNSLCYYVCLFLDMTTRKNSLHFKINIFMV